VLLSEPMTTRKRFLTMMLAVCHLLLILLLFTSQLHAQAQDGANQATTAGNGAPEAGANNVADWKPRTPTANQQDVTFEATGRQEKTGNLYRLSGDVKIRYGVFTLQADEVTYNDDTGEATAEGHVILDGGPHDEHIEASRGSYNFKTQNGEFHKVYGTTGIRLRGRSVTLTSPNPFYFQGMLVTKTGDRIVVNHGSVTSCELPHPKWIFAVGKADVEVGDEARLYHSTFRVLGIPIFYLPYLQYPVTASAARADY